MAPRPDAADTIVDTLLAAAGSAEDTDAAAATTVRTLGQLPGYSWVGIYWVESSDLVLGPWTGPEATEHTRIPIGTGICGAAAASGRTEIVDDVATDDRYLACFLGTRSEIVVPIKTPDGAVVGEIDVDGDEVGAFGPADAEALEEVADALGRRAAATPPTRGEAHDVGPAS